MQNPLLRLILLIVVVLQSTDIMCQIQPEGFVETQIADSLNPTSIVVDHHNRVWVAEKNGVVRIYNETGQENQDPVLILDVDDFNERGLEGIALHPDFDNEPYLYVYYTVPELDHNRVSRFLINGDLVAPDSEEILLELDSLIGTVHNGGAMLFDEAQFLFISTGDGARPFQAQSMSNTLGKVLRVNADGSIPMSNPFYFDNEGIYRAIYATGLRNPFSLTYDPIAEQLFCTDVGQDDFEEINLLLPGKNYGWPFIEGPIGGQTPPLNYADPIFSYDHDYGCAAVGLNLYRPESSNFPTEYQGKLFSSDYCNGQILIIDPFNSEVIDTFAKNIERPLKIETDQLNGNMYYLARAGIGGGSPQDNSQSNAGSLWKIEYTGSGIPSISSPPQSTLAAENEFPTFQVRANGTRPLRFDWYVSDTLFASDVDSLTLGPTRLAQHQTTIYVIAHNAFGADTSEVAFLEVTSNNRPTISIIEPLSNGLFNAGDTIKFEGFVFDEEDGLIPPDLYTWTVDLHHNDHKHPVISNLSTGDGQFIISKNGETDPNIWYRIYLSAQDDDGFSNTTFIDIYPNLSTIHLLGPKDFKVNIDGRIRELPTSIQSLVNLERSISTEAFQKSKSVIGEFISWADGNEDNPRIISADESNMIYKLVFDTIPLGAGTGLIGDYFNSADRIFNEPIDTTRIDKIIEFFWNSSSPIPGRISPDNFLVRWTGLVQPAKPGDHTFHVRSDDGIRLYLDGELIIDDWTNHAPTTNSEDYIFESNKPIPIVLEYFEAIGGAQVQLMWSSKYYNNDIIPTSQLYPNTIETIRGAVLHDLVNSNELSNNLVGLAQLKLVLINAMTNQIILETETDSAGNFLFPLILSGEYFIQILPNERLTKLRAFSNLDELYRTPIFNIDRKAILDLNLIFKDQFPADTFLGSNNFIRISPNPAMTMITITTIGEDEIFNIDIINSLGQSVVNGEILTGSKIDISNLASGMYFVQYESNFGSGIKPFVKIADQ